MDDLAKFEEIWNKPRAIPDYGSIYTIEEFMKYCEDGTFMDCDGDGRYTDRVMMYDHVEPSDILNGNISMDYDYIIWFNK
jgi:hypothetical protein